VDFVIYGEKGFWAIEVKNAGTVRPRDLRGLRSFTEEYPSCEPVFLYRGDARRRIDGIACVPAADFLGQLRPNHRLLP
jgi:hypothetical protein